MRSFSSDDSAASADSASLPHPVHTMQNTEGVAVDLYIPRKCSATNRLITAKDHASVQIDIAHVDNTGTYNQQITRYALCGYIRNQGRSDEAVNRLAARDGFTSHVFEF